MMKGKCPHCLHDVLFMSAEVHYGGGNYGRSPNEYIGVAPTETLGIRFLECPNCSRLVVLGKVVEVDTKKEIIRNVWPPSSRRVVPLEVPEAIKTDYMEAAETLPISSKASAAISRRCLQNVLVEAGGAKTKNLWDQIGEVLPHLPTNLAELVDSVRAVGNFGAHPIKSTSTGQIVAVEPGEAELNLEVLDGLFDFYYVQPERNKQRKAALNQKLKDAGKPPLR